MLEKALGWSAGANRSDATSGVGVPLLQYDDGMAD